MFQFVELSLPFLNYLLFPTIIIFLLFHFLQTKNPGRRRLPPSPVGVSFPILGHLHLLKKPLHRTLAKLSTQHGPILLLHFGSRPVLLVSSPSAAQECLTKNDIAFASRPRLSVGKHLGCNYTSLLWAPYGPHWRNQRRIATLQILSPTRIQMYGSVRTEEVKFLICRLCGGTGENGFRAVEMKRVFFETVLNVMMKMIIGKRYCGERESEEAERFRKIVKEGFEVSGATNMGDFLPNFVKWVGLWDGIEKRMERLQGLRESLMQNLIEERRKMRRDDDGEMKGCRVMADVLLDLQEIEPHYYTDAFIRGMMQGMLSAGTDTSSATMEWALSLLLNNPHSLLKAQAEIDAQVGPNRLLQESDLSNLPFLHSILKETLRIYPVAPLLVPHESSQDCVVGGFHVPRGTMLLINNWAIQNDPESWPDPSEFRPDRFQAGEVEELWRWLPFGAGRRGCPGEGLAMRMVGLTLGCLIQCFEWQTAGEEMVDMSEGGGLTMPKAKPLWANCRPRPILLRLLPTL
ncbi:cytochrome P450 81Q32-like [Benincasa hispida]|uniref:cytochrome P450 81Q32-like n=1 Tax=Benincasa hispida TaxID=102211 RepID=UPI0018FFC12A|nr:cytochrome P450 81Q32-like [Benincasa hispida]